MFIVMREETEDFEKIASGELTFITSTELANVGDYIAINEFNGYYTRRGVLLEVSAVIELEGCYVYAIQPCRIETHRRLTSTVYGEAKEGGSDEA